MALPAQRLQTDSAPDGWMPVTEAALRLGVNRSHLSRKCASHWVTQGLARLIDGAWFINPAADGRLRSAASLKGRDLQQLAELAAQGIDPKYIAIARQRVTTITGLHEFAMLHGKKSRRRQRELYLAHLKLSGADVPGVSQFYTWEKDYAESGLKGLVPAVAFRDLSQASPVGPHALERIEVIMNAGNSISLADAIRLAELDAARHPDDPDWRIPSYSSVRLAIQARRPVILRTLADKGERAARSDCIPKMPRDFEAIAAGDWYCGDERTLDLWCRVLTSRGWKGIREIKFTTWADMRSRMVVGSILAPHADSRTILGSVKLAINAYGKPLRLLTDWGKDYRKAARHGEYKDFNGEKIGNILDDLGIEVRKVAPYTPWAKPIESFFKTMKGRFDRLYAGFWGGCPSERHEDRAKYVKANLEKLPTITDIEVALNSFIDLYHHTPHGATDLFGKTPIEAMAAFREGPVRRESADVLNHLFKMFHKPTLVRRDGIRHLGHWYGTTDVRLIPLQGQRVILAMQPENSGVATVCDLKKRPLFDVECMPLSGLSERQAKEKRANMRRATQPYRKQAKDARDWMLDQDPAAILAAQANAAKAKRPAPAEAPPSLTIVRPDLEAAIENKQPAPSSEAASMAIRTGTYDDDEDALTNDMLDPSPFYAPQEPEEPEEDLW